MGPLRTYVIPGLAAVLTIVPMAQAQQNTMHIGYVYPAGGKQGSTFEAVIAGQFLNNVGDVYVSGGGVQAEIVDTIRPIAGKELNELRIQADELMARRAVVRKDFKSLERFVTFKDARNVKDDKESSDKEIEELKRKYANATWTAEDEKLLSDVRKKMSSGVRRPANPAISELAIVRLTVAPDAQPGQRDLRVASGSALSNPLVFHIGQLPEFSEEASTVISEQRSSIEKTIAAPKTRTKKADMNVTLPAVVNGQILPGAVDRFRFTARKGQCLVVAASARQLIPYIPDAVPGWFQATLALYDAQGQELVYDDDYRFNPDPVLFYQIPADGEYTVEIKDAIYRGREDFVYRIAIGELPFVTSLFPLGGRAGERTTVELKGWNLPVASLTLDNKDKVPGVSPVFVGQEDWVSNAALFDLDTLPESLEQEPNNEPQRAQRLTLPLIVNGRIDQPDDADVFRFEGRAGTEIVAEVNARRLHSPVDSVLTLTDASGRQVAMNDDYEDKGAGLLTHHADSWLRATLPADGTYYVQLTDGQHQGGPDYGYRLRISPPRPDFALRVAPASIHVRGGETVPLTVYALRKDGFSGEIAIELKDAPKGFTLSGARVPAQQDQVYLTLTALASSQEAPVSVRLEGRAVIDGRTVSHPAVPAEDMMQAFAYRHLVPVQELAVAVSGRGALKSSVQVLGELPVKIPAGGTARVQIAVGQGASGRLAQLQLFEPPEGIGIQRVSASRDGMEVVLTSDAEKVKPGLQGNLILTAASRTAGGSSKGKPQAKQRRAPVATLPAVPFEIVAP